MTERCRLCKSHKLPIHGVGPQPCAIMLIGEVPGKQEDLRRDHEGRGTPFIGESGQELNDLYLRAARLKRSEVYVTNCVRCLPGVGQAQDKSPWVAGEGGSLGVSRASSGGKQGGDVITPSPALAKCCSDHWLPSEIRYTRPEVIVTLGAVAYHTMFPNAMPLDLQHGIPFVGSYHDWSGWVFPMYHPAAGIRLPDMMTHMVEDWKRLGAWLNGEWGSPLDECPNPTYALAETTEDMDVFLPEEGETGSPGALLSKRFPRPVIANDTETVGSGGWRVPYCLSFSAIPGTGCVVMADRADLIAHLNGWMASHEPDVILHNAPFDVMILEQMGVVIDERRVLDTMMMAYHLQNLQQGLKPLAYRLCGMVMADFDDVVRPWSVGMVRDYVFRAYLKLVWPKAHSTAGVECVDYEDMPRNPFHRMPAPAKTKAGFRLMSVKQARSAWKKYLLQVIAGPRTREKDYLLTFRGKDVWTSDPDHEEYVETFVHAVNTARNGDEALCRKLVNLITDIDDKAAATDPWKRWEGWSDEDHVRVVNALEGEAFPSLSIAHVPTDDMVAYAARDADATLRIYDVLTRLSSNIFKKG